LASAVIGSESVAVRTDTAITTESVTATMLTADLPPTFVNVYTHTQTDTQQTITGFACEQRLNVPLDTLCVISGTGQMTQPAASKHREMSDAFENQPESLSGADRPTTLS